MICRSLRPKTFYLWYVLLYLIRGYWGGLAHIYNDIIITPKLELYQKLCLYGANFLGSFTLVFEPSQMCIRLLLHPEDSGRYVMAKCINDEMLYTVFPLHFPSHWTNTRGPTAKNSFLGMGYSWSGQTPKDRDHNDFHHESLNDLCIPRFLSSFFFFLPSSLKRHGRKKKLKEITTAGMRQGKEGVSLIFSAVT